MNGAVDMICLNCIVLAYDVHPRHLRKAFFTPDVCNEWKDFYNEFYNREELVELESRVEVVTEEEMEELRLLMERATQANITPDLPETAVNTVQEKPAPAESHLIVGKRKIKKKGKQGKWSSTWSSM